MDFQISQAMRLLQRPLQRLHISSPACAVSPLAPRGRGSERALAEQEIDDAARRTTRRPLALLLAALAVAVGCTDEPLAFRPNRLAEFRVSQELDQDLTSARRAIDAAVADLFGPVDQPRLPDQAVDAAKLETLLPIESIRRAAGPVRRVSVGEEKVEFGLYRKHCASCHGHTGDGYGPAAATLNPYPRDFRRGTFKFGTQGTGAPPSYTDLVRILSGGIPGTSMPAMTQLQSDEHFARDAEDLAHYVRFLAIRGEVERRLWLDTVFEFDDAAFAAAAEAGSLKGFPEELREAIHAAVRGVVARWEAVADGQPPAPPADEGLAFRWPEDLDDPAHRKAMLASAARGKELFGSEITACSQCHGPDGGGQGRLQDYDEWTKDWTLRAGVDPRDRSQWKPLKDLGLLKPVVDPPRNLRLGVFRGGDDPHLIFDRIAHGIDGTPMPAVPRAATSSLGLTDRQIWDLVNYVQSLAYEDS